jgi:hypothetical protein
MIISSIGGVVLIATHVVTGHVIHQWLDNRGVRLPTDAGAWAGLAFALYGFF